MEKKMKKMEKKNFNLEKLIEKQYVEINELMELNKNLVLKHSNHQVQI